MIAPGKLRLAAPFVSTRGFAHVAPSAQVVIELHKWSDSAQVAGLRHVRQGGQLRSTSGVMPCLSITSGAPADA